jgi:hypothetical protein
LNSAALDFDSRRWRGIIPRINASLRSDDSQISIGAAARARTGAGESRILSSRAEVRKAARSILAICYGKLTQ